MIFLVAPTVQTKILPRVGVRPIIMTGMALGALSMLLFFTRLTPSSSYAGHVLPGLLMIGVGMPCIFAPSFATATLGVDRYEAGVASAMVNTCQQVGGAVGTAVLSTIFATAAKTYTSSHARDARPGRLRRGPRLHHGVLLRDDPLPIWAAHRGGRAAAPHPARAAPDDRAGGRDGPKLETYLGLPAGLVPTAERTRAVSGLESTEAFAARERYRSHVHPVASAIV